MKILYFSQELPCSGHETLGVFIQDSINAIAQKEKVEVVSPKAKVLPYTWFPHHEFAQLPQKEETGPYTSHYPRYFYPVPKKLFYFLTPRFYSSSVTSYALKNIQKPDLIHCHNPYPDGPGVLKLVEEWKVPFVMHLRGSMDYYLDNTCMQQLVTALHKADAIIAVGEKEKESFTRKGIHPDKIHVIPNGVDMGLFKPRPKDSLRKKLKLPLQKKIILFVGSLLSIKGIEDLVATLKNFPDATFVIIGNGPLRSYVQKELPHAYVLGTQSREKTAEYMSAADLLVISSHSEGRPNTLYEALASNLPIVATEVGGIPELIRNGENGILVPPKSPMMLREAIRELLKNEKLLNKIGSQGRKTIEQHKLTWEEHARRLIEVYKKVVKKK
ncbi:MAG: glycosyltransferase [Nanoarchaeota archaeon]